MMDSDRVSTRNFRLTRRAALKMGAGLGAASLLAACGNNNNGATITSGAGGGTTPTAGVGPTPAANASPTSTLTGAAPSSSSPVAATSTQQAGAKQGGTLTLGYGLQQIQDLDPAQVAIGIVAGELVSNLFSSLVQFDEQLALAPDLAEKWDVSADALAYTFTLRTGLTFHNGDPLVAQDIVYTYERTINPDFASPHANKLKTVSSVTAVDDTTVSIKMAQPFGPFLAVACSRGPGRALTPVPKRAVEELGNDQFNLTPVGCGPFMMVPETMDVGTGFEMVAFENWYAGRPLLDKIVVKLIPEPASLVSALEAGDADMLDIAPPSGVQQLTKNNQITLVQAPGTNWIGVQINYKRAPWDNVDARLALAKGINKQDFIDKALFGLGVPSIGAIAPAFAWAYQPPSEVTNPQDFNLAEAKSLAQSSGLTGAKPVFLVNASNPRPAEVLRTMLMDVGVAAQIDQVQAAVFTERWTAGDYDLTIQGSTVDADPDDGNWNFFKSDGPWNTGGFNNPEADRILEATRATANQAERQQLWRQLQALLEKEAPFAFLYHAPDVTAFHTYVKGYRPIPEMRYLESLWLDK